MVDAVILDVDGTLVDSNDAHASAWVEAIWKAGFDVTYQIVRKLIGMGCDELLPAAIGIEAASPAGKAIQSARHKIFVEQHLSGIRAFPRVGELLQRLRLEGMKLVVASSAEKSELGALLERAGAADLIAAATSADDAAGSKPDPGVVQAALDDTGCRRECVVMLGDTPYDVEAARRAGVRIVGLRCGGWDDADLGGAVAIYEDAADLLENIGESVFSRRAAP